MELSRLDWILCKALDSPNLTEWESGFIDTLIEQREASGDEMFVSDKQEVVLERISEKC